MGLMLNALVDASSFECALAPATAAATDPDCAQPYHHHEPTKNRISNAYAYGYGYGYGYASVDARVSRSPSLSPPTDDEAMHEDEDEDEDEDNDNDNDNEPCLTAIHFAKQLVKFHGCCRDSHTLARKEHDEHVDRNGKGHGDLSIFDEFDAFVDAIGHEGFMKLSDYEGFCMEDIMEYVMEGGPRGAASAAAASPTANAAAASPAANAAAAGPAANAAAAGPAANAAAAGPATGVAAAAAIQLCPHCHRRHCRRCQRCHSRRGHCRHHITATAAAANTAAATATTATTATTAATTAAAAAAAAASPAAAGPFNVCLHWYEESAKRRQPVIKFDIDSVHVFPTSLAVARRGLLYNALPPQMSNLNSNVHLSIQAQYHDSRGKFHCGTLPIHRIPHYCLGRLESWDELSLYILFPAMYEEGRSTINLTAKNQQLWIDGVLLPAILEHLSASHIQHLPDGYEGAKLDSLAGSIEGRRRDTDPRPVPNTPNKSSRFRWWPHTKLRFRVSYMGRFEWDLGDVSLGKKMAQTGLE